MTDGKLTNEHRLEFMDLSLASLRQICVHIEQIRTELSNLQSYQAKSDPGRLNNRLGQILFSLEELERRWLAEKQQGTDAQDSASRSRV